MKKQVLIFVQILLLIISVDVRSQITTSVQITPNGMFDKVFDRFGKEYALADLEIQSTRRTIGSSSINSLSSYSLY